MLIASSLLALAILGANSATEKGSVIAQTVMQSSSSTSVQKEISGKNLPKSYRGDFTWRSGGSAERVNLYIRRIGIISGGTDIAISGWETYGVDVKTRVIVQGRIDPSTRHVILFEKNTRSFGNFVSDGSFEGEISPDLSKITLVWTTKSTGEKGDINFHATGRR